MSTKLYHQSGAAPITPIISTVWANRTDPIPTLRFSGTPGSAAVHTRSKIEISGSGARFCLFQFVSPPLSGQTINGSVSGVFGGAESHTSDDFYSSLLLQVVSPALTVRGTLLDTSSAIGPNEYGTALPPTSTKHPVFATLSSVNSQSGDFLVAQYGFISRSTGVSNCTGYLSFSQNQDSDLAYNAGLSLASDNTWLAFTDNITFV